MPTREATTGGHAIQRLHVGIVGLGRLGVACSRAIIASDDLALVGIVRRPESLGTRLPNDISGVPIVTHVGGLRDVGVALLCLPPAAVLGAAHDLLQHRVPIVECAALHAAEFSAHADAIRRIALHHRTPAIVGAGWDPGMLSVLRGIFALLAPKGHTQVARCRAAGLHHTLAARNTPGVKRALAADVSESGGERRRYVYVELVPGSDAHEVATTIRADPLFADADTVVVPVESIEALEEQGNGLVIERWGGTAIAAHQHFLLEARFDTIAVAAQTMLCAARAIPTQPPGAHSLFEMPMAALWGVRALEGEQRWT